KTTKHPVTSTTQSIPAEELERLEGEEEATTLPKETENSVVSTREATSLQTASTTTVAPLVVFPKTSKEPIEVIPATNVATTAEASEKEKKEEATTVGNKEEHNHEENEITSTKETLTEENILEIKSTTIATAQIYKSAEKKSEAETNLPAAATTNNEESPTTPTIVKQEATDEETKEKPTYPTEEERGNREVPGPGWQRTDFEEGQLWVQCKPPSIRALLWPWPTNRTFENGVLFAKDFHEESDCYAELDKDSGGGEARLDIGPGKCGLAGAKAVSFILN
uniref:Uncharacterized protein n=1 Tax=Meloidogyne javanica TaxID=6303 RepID=A0A915MKJ1_MELJA